MSKSGVTKDTIKHVANLIRIAVPEEKLAKFKEQLETALDPTRVFEKLNTENVEITSQTVGTKNILRDDSATESLSQEEAIKNAQDTENGYIVVKRVVNND